MTDRLLVEHPPHPTAGIEYRPPRQHPQHDGVQDDPDDEVEGERHPAGTAMP